MTRAQKTIIAVLAATALCVCGALAVVVLAPSPTSRQEAPEVTATPIATVAISTATPVPTDTPTTAPTATATPTLTHTPTHTPTAIAPPTPTHTPAAIVPSAPTGTPTATATATPSELSFVVEYLGCKSHAIKLGSVKGQVFDRQGRVIPGAQVEIWIDGNRWDDPANPATANQDGWYEWVLALDQVIRIVALYIDDQEVAIYPDNLEVPSVSRCFQHVNFRQQ
jgi:hypothetical protein